MQELKFMYHEVYGQVPDTLPPTPRSVYLPFSIAFRIHLVQVTIASGGNDSRSLPKLGHR